MLTDIPLDLNLLPELRGAYLVGGTTRDLLLGLRPSDYDIAVSQNPEIFAAMTAARCRGRMVPMGRPGKMSYRVIAGGTILDITGLNGPTIHTDLESRDITVNAIALDLASGRLVDHVGGMEDLLKKRIRMVSDACFTKDPVRLLRVFRLAAVLGFSIDKGTLAAVSRDADLIRLVAGERIRSELHALFSCGMSHAAVVQMDNTGLLTGVFPELARLRAATSRACPGPDPLFHTLSAYRKLEHLLSNPPPVFRGKTDDPSPLHPSQAPWLKCALLLHHIESSQSAVEKISGRLRLSVAERKLVTGILGHHEDPLHLFDRYPENIPCPKATTRFFMAHDTLVPHLMLHALADTGSDISDRRHLRGVFSDFVDHILGTYHNQYLLRKMNPPLVTGHDLVNIFHLTPSPLFGKILTRLEEERLSGNLQDRKTALDLAGKIIQMFS